MHRQWTALWGQTFRILQLTCALVALAALSCAGEERVRPPAPQAMGSISGILTLPSDYPVTIAYESADSDTGSELNTDGALSGRPLVVMGSLDSGIPDIFDTTLFLEGGAATYDVMLSVLGVSGAATVELEVTYSAGGPVTSLATMQADAAPATGTFAVTGGSGAIFFDLELMSGTAAAWRIDIEVVAGNPARSGRGKRTRAPVDRPAANESSSTSEAADGAVPRILSRRLATCDCVPGRLLVHFRSEASSAQRTETLTRFGFRAVRTLSCGTFIAERLSASEHVCRATTASAQPAGEPSVSDLDVYQPCERTTLMERLTLARLAALVARSPIVAFAEPDWLCQPFATPDDPQAFLNNAEQAWHYDVIGLRAAWDITTGDPSVMIAVLDTGFTLTHPDLGSRLAAGYDFVSDPTDAGDGDGIDADPGRPAGIAMIDHGTHVAGTVGAVSNNGTGVAGVTWNCPVMAVRVIGTVGVASDAAEGVRYAAGLANASGTLPAVAARVMNMSLGWPVESDALKLAIDDATAAGCIVIAAAGNSGSAGTVAYPAAWPNVISIGAINAQLERASYSSANDFVEYMAPGGEPAQGVYSTYMDYYESQTGTSMAAPHVAGVVGLMLSENPALTLTDVRDVLSATAIDLGAAGSDSIFANGLIDAAAAVAAAGGVTPPGTGTPVASLSAPALVLQPGQSSAALTIANAGSGTLSIGIPEAIQLAGETWLDASPGPVSSSSVIVEIAIDRGTLTGDGVYAGCVAVTTNAPAMPLIILPVIVVEMSVPATDETVLVEARDPLNSIVVTTTTTGAASYAYTLDGLAAGNWIVSALVDRNGDDNESDGDLSGAYPIRDQPQPIDVAAGATLTAIDFTLAPR